MKTATPLPRESKDGLFIEALKGIVKEAVHEELQEALSAQNSKPPKLLVTAAEGAELLSVPKTWLEARAREGSLQSVKCGHYRLFAIEDLKSFIEKAKSGNGMGVTNASNVPRHRQISRD